MIKPGHDRSEVTLDVVPSMSDRQAKMTRGVP